MSRTKKLLTYNESKHILTTEGTNNMFGQRKEGETMPLTMVHEGEPSTIKRIGGKEETRRFLEKLGFVTGSVVTVVSTIGGNMIVNVKDTRVAIGKDMAKKIMV